MTYKRAKMALLTGVSITILSGQAFAGNWDGFSFGIGGGYGIANNELGIAPKGLIDDAKLTIDGFGGKGGFFTFGAGYDRTIFNNLVIGAFVDYDVSDIDTTLSLSIPPLADANARADFNIENQLSIGGRLGYLVSPTTLFFTTFGYARVETSNIKASLGSDVGSISGTLASVGNFNGYFVGGGVETLISNGFSIKGEYRYTSLQTEGATVLPGTGISDFVGASLKPQIQTGRVSLNYRFGGGSRNQPTNRLHGPQAPGRVVILALAPDMVPRPTTLPSPTARPSPDRSSTSTLTEWAARAGSFPAQLVTTIRQAPELSSARLPTPTFPICTTTPVWEYPKTTLLSG